MKKLIFTLFTVLSLAATAFGQGSVTQTSLTSPICAGMEVPYQYSGSCSISWQIEGGGTIVSSTASTVRVRWSSATTSGYVIARCISTPSLTVGLPVTVNASAPPAVSLTGPTTVCGGASSSYQASPTNGGSAPSYSWLVNGVSKQSGSSATFATTQLVQGDVVSVQMTSNLPCVTTSQATSSGLTIGTVTPPLPVSVSISGLTSYCPGQSSGAAATYSASATNGGASPSYTWYRNGSAVSDNELTGNQYRSHYGLGDGDKITCRLNSSLTGCIANNGSLSNEITVRIINETPLLRITSSKSSFCSGDEVTFTATSNFPLSNIQWKIDNSVALSSSPTFTVSSLSPSNTVYLTATPNTTCPTSATLSANTQGVVTIRPAIEAAITPTGTKRICANCSEVLTATTNAGAGYQWLKDNQAIAGATSATYTANSAGNYSVVVSQLGCSSKTSNVFNLKMNLLPIVNAGADITVIAPNSVQLKGSASDPDGGLSAYQWSVVSGNADVVFFSDASMTPTLTGLLIGTYVFRLTATDNDFKESNYDEVTVVVAAPVNNYNYILTNSIQKAGVKTPAQLNALLVGDKQQSIMYFDGLGRPMQSVITQGSPAGKDLVQPIQYDGLGRQAFQFLPYTDGSNGYFKTNALASKSPLEDLTAYQATKQYQFYQSVSGPAGIAYDTKPFAQALYEASPLSRVTQQGAAGLAWQPVGTDPKSVKMTWRNNVANEVRLFTYSFTSDGTYGTVSTTTFYGAGQLYVSEITDEHGYKVMEFKDKNGQLVLKKVQFKGTKNSTSPPPDADCLLTYSVYDSFSRLRMVIQPEGSELIPTTGVFTPTADANFIDNWCFTYHYDVRGRIAEKKVPGSGMVYQVYNIRDNLILTQDAKQRPGMEWNVIKYDSLGRVAMTGLYVRTTVIGQAAMQEEASGRAACYENQYKGLQGYTVNKAFPDLVFISPGKDKLYTVNHYNEYDTDRNGTRNYSYEGGSAFDRNIGRLTVSKVARTDNTGWLATAYFYDSYGRVIQTQADNHLGGRQLNNTIYDEFTERVKSTTLVHTTTLSTASTLTVKKRFEYDKYGRLTNRFQQNQKGTNPADTEEALSVLVYNELGQLLTKKVGTGDGEELQLMDYRYNIRGWLSAINPDALQTPTRKRLFGLELLYNTGKNLGGIDITNGQFNGNLAAQKWKSFVSDNSGSTAPMGRMYSYTYDPLNRITRADYSQATAGMGENFSMGSVTYSKNGNIKSLQQSGLLSYTTTPTQLKANFGVIDNLSYSYSGNRLLKVEEVDTDTDPVKVSSNVSATGLAGDFQNKKNGTIEYTYDSNGNLEVDENKQISSIIYNYLNLPTQIWMNPGGTNRIVYLYDAAGTKLRKEVYEDGKGITSWTDYAGGFIYQKDVLEFFGTQEGRVLNPYFLSTSTGPSAYVYEYHYQDHLGNLRLSFRNPRKEVKYRVGAELTDAVNEEANFANVKKTRQGPSASIPRAGSYWIGLNAPVGTETTGSLGPWKTVKVKAGDQVSANVYARYTAATASSGVTLSTYLSTANNVQAGAESGTKLPLLQLGITLSPVPAPGSGLPKAYLRYEYFDENNEYIKSAYYPVTITATTQWELLTMPSLTATKDGYVQIYLANESNLEVRFDELVISYSEAMVVQENHYNPWGNNLVGIETQGQPNNEFQYNGKEKQAELGLNWIDYGARFYDPQLGRWHSGDPRGERFYPLSGYSYSANSPILLNDPSGKDWTISMTEDKNGKKNYSITFKGAVFNSSKNKNVDMVGLAAGLLKQANSLFNQKGADFSISFKGSIRVINNKKELDKKETLFIVTDPTHEDFNPKDKKADDVIVGSTRNGKEIRLNEEYIDLIAIGGKGIGPYAPHEMGHTAGLEHPEEDSWFYFFDGPTADSPASNFMRTTKESKNNPTGPTKEQIERMYRLYNDGKLNRKDINPANED